MSKHGVQAPELGSLELLEPQETCTCGVPDPSWKAYQYSTLHVAALQGCVRCVRMQLGENCSVNPLTFSGQTPLYLALYRAPQDESREEVAFAAGPFPGLFIYWIITIPLATTGGALAEGARWLRARWTEGMA